MALWPAAVRYSTGRPTGAYEHPLALAWALRRSLTPADRPVLIAGARDARSAALSARLNRSSNSNRGEAEDWSMLISALGTDDGAGDDELVELLGRDLALTAVWAVRELLNAPPGAPEAERVAAACEHLAIQFSPADRVLLMRQIAEHSHMITEAIAPEWERLYQRLSEMPLDEAITSRSRLPRTL